MPDIRLIYHSKPLHIPIAEVNIQARQTAFHSENSQHYSTQDRPETSLTEKQVYDQSQAQCLRTVSSNPSTNKTFS